MKVTFVEISIGKPRYKMSVADVFPVPEIDFCTVPQGEFILQRKNELTVSMSGNLSVGVELSCDLCGETFCHPMNVDYIYIFKVEDDALLRVQEVECNEESCHTVYLKEPVIDVSEVLREQIVLAVPVKRLCDEKCKGMCPRCGVDLNHGNCRCSDENPDSPFALLKQLKKQ